MLFVSFYTPPYAAEAEGLIQSLGRWNLNHEIVAVADRGSWVKNCAYKASFIRDMMLKHECRPLVWLDADARVMRRPDLFDSLTCDLACHYRDGTELLSGTLYIGPTARDLVRQWEQACLEHPNEWDQRVLAGVIERERRWKIINLPADYTAIFDAGMSLDPVILHRQASRRLKH